MKRNLLFSMLSVFFLIAGTTAAQTTDSASYYGNLLRIPMLADTVSPSDTLGSWEDLKYWDYGHPGRQYSFYYGHLSLQDREYLLKQKEWYMFYSYMESYGGENILETEGEKEGRGFSLTDVAMGDVQPPLQVEVTEVTRTPSGCWLINGSLGNAFLGSNDSLYRFPGPFNRQYSQAMEENLIFILGQVGDRYLGAFITDNYNPWYNGPEYRLMDLSNSPHITEYSPAIKFYGLPDPDNYRWPGLRISLLYNDLYIAGNAIFRFADTSFNYVKPLIFSTDETQISSGLSGKKFYNWEGINLCSYDLKLSDTTFVNRKVLMQVPSPGDHLLGIDRDFRYIAKIDGDTLRIFDIKKESYINAISIKGVNRPMRPIVDSPYVYLHQTTRKVTDVKDEKIQAAKSYTLSAYPNPFNPVTTLEFNIPAAGKVELKVYDILGKEVTTLVNEERKAGNYKVQFNASSLPSGIYLCRMSSGKYNVVKKIALLK
ncbi:MAG TPA: T9SS type A sorting domain-containing protein [Ignavibacteriales bacterium]|nr:T9SS type A sorting domain-containing protein [Ignavibacteriales bacterium]